MNFIQKLVNVNSFYENLQLVIYSLVSFFVPFLIGNQLIVGSLVNCALVLAALNLDKYKVLPIIFLPSIAVFLSGVIFGPFNMYLVYFIPFIWIGNSLLVFTVKYFNRKRVNRILMLIFSSSLKSLFLFSIAALFFSLGFVPVIFLTVMGLLQFYTACIGFLLAFTVQYFKNII